jgi:DNA-binding LytR/AlgR family response regulator
MKPVRIYILEDEMITQEVIKQTLESMNCIVCGMQSNAEKALDEIQSLKPDIVFLDIRVDGDKTGIWLGNQLKMPIVYLTAFSDQKNIRDAVQTNPVSYVQKPFKEKDILIALELAKSKLAETKELLIKDKSLTVRLNVNHILYAKKEDHYLILHTHNGNKMIRSTVQEFLEKVTDDFMQVHRSYIINKNFVSGISNKVVMIRGDEIPISLSYLKSAKKELL